MARSTLFAKTATTPTWLVMTIFQTIALPNVNPYLVSHFQQNVQEIQHNNVSYWILEIYKI